MESDPSERFFEATRESLKSGTFVKLTLGKHRGGDHSLKNVYARLAEVKGDTCLSLTFRYATRDAVQNFDIEEGIGALRELLGAEFLSGHLFTTTRDIQIEYNRKREARLIEKPPTFETPPAHTHDRKKRRLIEPKGSVYLRALGVTNERGEVRERMGDKFRQINRFVETLAQLLESSLVTGKKELSVVDMGSGKGYLTFAVYDYLRNALGLSPKVVGVEQRDELVELCNRVASEAGFDGLSFMQGLISDFEIKSTDILIALHACDTATDEAIYKGVAAGASVIITAPCCHKELRTQIASPEVLSGMLKHGILLERQTEMLTDTMRALLLEAAGYKTRVFEFISTEHTHKNTMIAAVRRAMEGPKGTALRQLNALKEFYGVSGQRLERLICENPSLGVMLNE